MARLDGSVVLISGAARGMGASHARAVVAAGGKVVIGDILDSDGELLAKELGEAARFTHLDVTRLEDWLAAVALAEKEFGKLTGLVNNAGILNFGTLEDYEPDTWAKTIAINLTGQFLGCKAATPALKRSAPAAIVNISSVDGMVGEPERHGYCASKWGVRGLTKSVAAELAPAGVRCNSVHPGAIYTPMTGDLGLTADSDMSPLGRIGKAEEISALVVFLLSDESSYSTGSEFVADGGMLASAESAAEN